MVVKYFILFKLNKFHCILILDQPNGYLFFDSPKPHTGNYCDSFSLCDRYGFCVFYVE